MLFKKERKQMKLRVVLMKMIMMKQHQKKMKKEENDYRDRKKRGR